jgi:hypothetical protein
VIGQSFAIAQDRMAPLWRSAADLVIEPDVAAFEYDDFKRAADLVRAGEEAMRKALPTVRQWLEAPVETTRPQQAAALRNARPAMAKPAPMPAD